MEFVKVPIIQYVSSGDWFLIQVPAVEMQQIKIDFVQTFLAMK